MVLKKSRNEVIGRVDRFPRGSKFTSQSLSEKLNKEYIQKGYGRAGGHRHYSLSSREIAGCLRVMLKRGALKLIRSANKPNLWERV